MSSSPTPKAQTEILETVGSTPLRQTTRSTSLPLSIRHPSTVAGRLRARSLSPPVDLKDPKDPLGPCERSAAIAVYHQVELRCMILGYLRPRTLLTTMVVSRSLLETVAEMLYANIDSKRSEIMQRAAISRKPNLMTYFASVQVLDISASPIPYGATRSHLLNERVNFCNLRIPVRFSPTSPQLVKAIATFPNLRRIINRRNAILGDDTWIAIIGSLPKDSPSDAEGADPPETVAIVAPRQVISVSLHRVIDLTVDVEPFMIPVLPPTPIFPGVLVTQTYTVRLHTSNPVYRFSTEAAQLDHQNYWRSYLSSDQLDSRVTQIDSRPVATSSQLRRWTMPSITEFITFLDARTASHHQPWRSYQMEAFEGDQQDIDRIFKALGPSLQELKVDTGVMDIIGDLQLLIQKVDRYFPHLESLRVVYMPRHSEIRKLRGAQNLRLFTYSTIGQLRESYLSGIGGRYCVYQDQNGQSMKSCQRQQTEIDKEKYATRADRRDA